MSELSSESCRIFFFYVKVLLRRIEDGFSSSYFAAGKRSGGWGPQTSPSVLGGYGVAKAE